MTDKPDGTGGPTVFTWLDNVRERSSMYASTPRELESLIRGYYTALDNHGIVEPVPSMSHHFLIWTRYRTRWSLSGGWAVAIEAHVSNPDKRFARFFRLIDEYRQLQPTLLCTVRLKQRHQPTGRRLGLDERMKKPKRVDIFRYVPEPLHFLRFHYRDKIDDGWILLNSDHSERTTIRDAKRLVRDELQVQEHEWQEV